MVRNVAVLVSADGVRIHDAFAARLDELRMAEQSPSEQVAQPIAWKGTRTQYLGRLHRLYHGQPTRDVFVYDYIDEAVPVLKRMRGKRVRGYKGLGYSIDDAPVKP